MNSGTTRSGKKKIIIINYSNIKCNIVKVLDIITIIIDNNELIIILLLLYYTVPVDWEATIQS
jgi:hypothetical protein